MTTDPLFAPLQLGALALPQRIVMAPLTRNRAGRDGVPTPLMRDYYQQRATAGLIITESTAISPQGRGVPGGPGIHTPEQGAGWAAVTGAVHAAGGRIMLQLWHAGSFSHSSLHSGRPPVAPSPVPFPRKVPGADFSMLEPEIPRALETAEIAAIVEDYRSAAERALRAGFDGVEIHAANGYLIDEFLHESSNQRTDAYGGSAAARSRFLLEVLGAVTSVWGADRVGVRFSPHNAQTGLCDSDPDALYRHVLGELDQLQLAYLHLVDPRSSLATVTDAIDADAMFAAVAKYRSAYTGKVITAGGYTHTTAVQAVKTGHADAVAFGRSFIANPDLVQRLRSGAALNPYDRSTFYTSGPSGYTDYPYLPPAR
ncbi:alkene reductase [Streptomyces sp. NPDC048409]|uniref:alkene reductase n=1 Tax=Streptomyces sp. NPDC048409 TaxID=3154723 RepID=UPI003434C362